jgi:exonuclease VII large subunit
MAKAESQEVKKMMYDITEKVREIANIEGATIEKIADELNLRLIDGKVIANNRKQEGAADLRLNSLKADIKKIENIKAVKAGYHWVKDEEGWAVAGDFTGKREGDEIIVLRRDGTKQIKMIERFSNIGNAYVC